MQGTKDSHDIFVSHRSEDVKIVSLLLNFLGRTGIPATRIFCSSIPANGVDQNVSNEVKQALRNSKINIVILSNAFYESAYCLNEAGVLWFLEGVPVIPIALPEITQEKMTGFLDGKYTVPRHLDSKPDVFNIYGQIINALGEPQVNVTIVNDACTDLIDTYKQYINNERPAPRLSIYEELEHTKRELKAAQAAKENAYSEIKDLKMIIYNAASDPSVLNDDKIVEMISDMIYASGNYCQHLD